MTLICLWKTLTLLISQAMNRSLLQVTTTDCDNERSCHSGEEMSDDDYETVISIEHNPIVYNKNHADDIIDAVSRSETENWQDCNIVNNDKVCNKNHVDNIIEFVAKTETNA